MPKNGLKIDEFMTRQIPLKLKFCLSPSKEKKILFVLKQFSFIFKDIFLLNPQLGREHKLVVKIFLKMFSIQNQEAFQLSSLNSQIIDIV